MPLLTLSIGGPQFVYVTKSTKPRISLRFESL